MTMEQSKCFKGKSMPNKCPLKLKKCTHYAEGVCTVAECVNYVEYRKITGRCEVCGAKMEVHPRCDSCGILIGKGHQETEVAKVGDGELCGHCQSGLEKYGFLQIEAHRRIMPSGNIEPEYIYLEMGSRVKNPAYLVSQP